MRRPSPWGEEKGLDRREGRRTDELAVALLLAEIFSPTESDPKWDDVGDLAVAVADILCRVRKRCFYIKGLKKLYCSDLVTSIISFMQLVEKFVT